jgi:hypothetical protein
VLPAPLALASADGAVRDLKGDRGAVGIGPFGTATLPARMMMESFAVVEPKGEGRAGGSAVFGFQLARLPSIVEAMPR